VIVKEGVGVDPGMVWLLAVAYIVTIGCFVVAAWIAGIAGICDTCQGQDYSGTQIGPSGPRASPGSWRALR
jgi:hypothetical protein